MGFFAVPVLHSRRGPGGPSRRTPRRDGPLGLVVVPVVGRPTRPRDLGTEWCVPCGSMKRPPRLRGLRGKVLGFPRSHWSPTVNPASASSTPAAAKDAHHVAIAAELLGGDCQAATCGTQPSAAGRRPGGVALELGKDGSVFEGEFVGVVDRGLALGCGLAAAACAFGIAACFSIWRAVRRAPSGRSPDPTCPPGEVVVATSTTGPGSYPRRRREGRQLTTAAKRGTALMRTVIDDRARVAHPDIHNATDPSPPPPGCRRWSAGRVA